MRTTWLIPDGAGWRDEAGYNPHVTTALACACEQVQQGGKIDLAAFACIAPIIEAEMSKRQRIRVLYVAGAYYATNDPTPLVLEPIDEALELTIELRETRAQIDLLLLRASINRCITQIPDAADDLRDCLQALVSLNLQDNWTADDRLTTLKATLRLAAQEFITGAYDECQGWLDHAAILLPQVGEHTDSLARYTWSRALLSRWRGDYVDALQEAISAVKYYRTLRDPQNLSRIEATAGDILLDLAERSRIQDNEAGCATYLEQAEPYVERALHIAMASEYKASEVGALIIRARLHLMQQLPGDRKPLLEELANMAWQNQDMPAVCKAYTGIGRECEAAFEITSAKEWYRRAITVLNESQAVADAVWAQRALWRLEGEMSVGV